MKKNESIQKKDLNYKRPGIGIKPELTHMVIGRKLKKDLEFDHMVKPTDFV